MIASTVAEIIKAIHRHPLFNLTLAVALLVFVNFSLKYFAYAEEVEANKLAVDIKLLSLDDRISSLDKTLKRNHLEQQLRMLESDVMQWERLLSQGAATDQQHEWLIRLRTDLSHTKRQLQRLDGISYE